MCYIYVFNSVYIACHWKLYILKLKTLHLKAYKYLSINIWSCFDSTIGKIIKINADKTIFTKILKNKLHEIKVISKSIYQAHLQNSRGNHYISIDLDNVAYYIYKTRSNVYEKIFINL